MTKAKAAPKTTAKAAEVVEVPNTNAIPTDAQISEGAKVPTPAKESVVVNQPDAAILPTPNAILRAVANATPTPEQIANGAPDVVPVVVIGDLAPEVEAEIHAEYGVPIGVPLTFAQSQKITRMMRAAGVDLNPSTVDE